MGTPSWPVHLITANDFRNRYLILDVLGQGTFGQVVKCQNLKTQEVVAVKVVKNRTAYFNQSMMEVSVLDLVLMLFDSGFAQSNLSIDQ